jgi:hypothetical protein
MRNSIQIQLALSVVFAISAIQANGQSNTKTNQDVTSPQAIVSAFFESGSGPAGPRDFNRMRSLFAPEARLITIRRPENSPAVSKARSIDDYIKESQSYLASNANFEKIKNVWVEQYANLAHVFCSFEARKTPDGEVFDRAVGSFQLLWDGTRWWIVSAYWQGERPGEPLPLRYR